MEKCCVNKGILRIYASKQTMDNERNHMRRLMYIVEPKLRLHIAHNGFFDGTARGIDLHHDGKMLFVTIAVAGCSQTEKRKLEFLHASGAQRTTQEKTQSST